MINEYSLSFINLVCEEKEGGGGGGGASKRGGLDNFFPLKGGGLFEEGLIEDLR